jgi:hypothetical protein
MLAKSLYQCQDLIGTEDGEVTEEQLQQIVLRHTETMDKLKSLCGFIRYLEHGIDACKQERNRIAQMQKTAENRLDRIKEFLTPFVQEKGRIQLDTVTLSVRKSVAVEVAEGFNDPYFCKVVTERVPDKRAIKEALKNNEPIEGAQLVTRFNLQVK